MSSSGTSEDPRDPSANYDAELARGSILSAVGFLGKLLQPLVFLAVTWGFGPSTTGVFLLVTFLVDMFRGATVDGYADAVTVVASWGLGLGRGEDDAEAGRTRLRDVTGGALRATLAISVAAIPLVFLTSPWLGRTFFAEHRGFSEALRLSALDLPFVAFATIALASTRALFRIHYQVVLQNFVRPLGTLVAVLIASAAGAGLRGLLLGMLVVDGTIALAAALALARELGGRPSLKAFVASPSPPGLHSLAIPQSANMTLNRYLTRIDALMLGAMGASSEAVAFYGTGALITSSLREAKLVFTAALAPIVARHHGAGDVEAISAVIGRISRWTGTIILPLILVLVVMRADVLRWIDSRYVGDTAFVLALLVPSYLIATSGLAGNCVFYTGHSRWNLANSLGVAALNTGLNLLLIPSHGLFGAAVATAIASTAVAAAELVELRMLEGIRIPWRDIRSLQVGFFAALSIFFVVGDPSRIPDLGTRVVVCTLAVLVFFVVATLAGHVELVARARVAFRRGTT